jgi:two-component system cell cycle response regulator
VPSKSPTDAGSDHPSRRKSDGQRARRVTVLAVDQDRSYLAYLRLFLSRAGYEVRTADNAESAIEVLRQERIDLVLIDLDMPQMDGIQTVQRVQADEDLRNLHSILLNASTRLETKLRALDRGSDDGPAGPPTETEILAKLGRAARRLEFERRLNLENEELQTLALTDELTGIANRRSLMREAERMLRAGHALAVVLFDLNRFKEVNDTYGHVAGDRILADVGAVFRTHTRFGDVVGRYGGDEFLMLLPDATPEEARAIAQRLDGAICQLKWSIRGTLVEISTSCGVAAAPADMETSLQDLLTTCDEELYERKQNGRHDPARPS